MSPSSEELFRFLAWCAARYTTRTTKKYCVGGIWHTTLLVDEAHALGGKTSSEGVGPTLAASIEDARWKYVRYCEAYLRSCDEPAAAEGCS